MRRRAIRIGIAAACLVLATTLMSPYVRTAAFLLDLAGHTGLMRRLLPVRASPVRTSDVMVPTRYGPVEARLVDPDPAATRTVVVFPGVHSGGVDEPRLAAFSRRLAATGVRVISVPLPDLREFRVTARTTDVIEDAIAWIATEPSIAPVGQVGVAGVSFAGGLALIAAGRPALSGKVRFVVSIGGHADLPRVMTYLCTGRLEDGTERAPHDYGVAIILLSSARRLLPAAEAAALERAVTTFLVASSDAEYDAVGAEAGFAEARRLGEALAEPGRTYMRWVVDRNTTALGPVLLPHVEELGGAPALSPERSPAASVPTFLLHGDQDNVIPSSETPRLAAYLTRQGGAPVRWLLTPILSHAHIQEHVALDEAWSLVSFWKALLAAAR